MEKKMDSIGFQPRVEEWVIRILSPTIFFLILLQRTANPLKGQAELLPQSLQNVQFKEIKKGNAANGTLDNPLADPAPYILNLQA
jgi:hypothetical protein